MSVEKTEVQRVWLFEGNAISLCWNKRWDLELLGCRTLSWLTYEYNDLHYHQFSLSCGPKKPCNWALGGGSSAVDLSCQNINLLRIGVCWGRGRREGQCPPSLVLWSVSMSEALGDISRDLGLAWERPCPLLLPVFIFFHLNSSFKTRPRYSNVWL